MSANRIGSRWRGSWTPDPMKANERAITSQWSEWRTADVRTLAASVIVSIIAVAAWGLLAGPVVSDGHEAPFPLLVLSHDPAAAGSLLALLAIGAGSLVAGFFGWRLAVERSRSLAPRLGPQLPGDGAWLLVFTAIAAALPVLHLDPGFTTAIESAQGAGQLVVPAGIASHWVFTIALLGCVAILGDGIVTAAWRRRIPVDGAAAVADRWPQDGAGRS